MLHNTAMLCLGTIGEMDLSLLSIESFHCLLPFAGRLFKDATFAFLQMFCDSPIHSEEIATERCLNTIRSHSILQVLCSHPMKIGVLLRDHLQRTAQFRRQLLKAGSDILHRLRLRFCRLVRVSLFQTSHHQEGCVRYPRWRRGGATRDRNTFPASSTMSSTPNVRYDDAAAPCRRLTPSNVTSGSFSTRSFR